MKRVAVIGAGIAGLSCAYDLQRAGLTVNVYEREPQVGGRMSTRTKDGLAFDLGATFLNRTCRTVIGLAQELGLPVRDPSPVEHLMVRKGASTVRWSSIACPSPAPGLSNWRWPNYSAIQDVFRMKGLQLWTRLKFLLFIVKMRWKHRSTLDLYDLSTLAALNTELTDTAARREVSQEFADILDGYLSFMMLSRASDTSQAIFLSLFSISMTAKPAVDFSPVNLEGYMQAIPDALASRLEVRRGCPVEQVRAVEQGSPLRGTEGGETTGWEVRTSAGCEVYDRVVVATTGGAARRFLPDGPARALVASMRYASTIMVAFRVPSSALGRVQCTYVPVEINEVVSGFTNEALKCPESEWALVNVGLHDQAAVRLLGATDEEIFAVVRRELFKVSPELACIADQVLPHDLQRWAEAIPRYDCGHIARVVQFLETEQGRGGIYLCGDAMNAPWTEGASRSGRNVALRILAEG